MKKGGASLGHLYYEKMIKERNMVNLQARKILKKKENPLSPTPVFTKMKLQALIATGQALGGAICKTI